MVPQTIWSRTQRVGTAALWPTISLRSSSNGRYLTVALLNAGHLSDSRQTHGYFRYRPQVAHKCHLINLSGIYDVSSPNLKFGVIM
jgi:hypothetical protein